MTELRSTLDNAVLGELRESVGDDPEFVAEVEAISRGIDDGTMPLSKWSDVEARLLAIE